MFLCFLSFSKITKKLHPAIPQIIKQSKPVPPQIKNANEKQNRSLDHLF